MPDQEPLLDAAGIFNLVTDGASFGSGEIHFKGDHGAPDDVEPKRCTHVAIHGDGNFITYIQIASNDVVTVPNQRIAYIDWDAGGRNAAADVIMAAGDVEEPNSSSVSPGSPFGI